MLDPENHPNLPPTETQPDPNEVIGVYDIPGQESAPIPPALKKVIEDSDLTMKSPIGAMFDAAHIDNPGATAVRQFGFGQHFCALVFNGPEAELLCLQFVRYAEALMDTIATQAEKADRKAQEAAGRGDPRGALASIGIRRQ